MDTFQRYSDTVIVPAKAEDLFAFYTDVNNLLSMLSPNLLVKILKADNPLKLGSRVEFEVGPRNLPVSVRWVSEIVAFDPPHTFEDRQANGPFSRWVHRHEFTPLEDGRTKVVDIIEVGKAQGILGHAVNSMLLGKNIAELFHYRRQILQDKFGPILSE